MASICGKKFVLSDSFQPSGTRKKAFFAATQLNISELHI
jgi:hypothetical protein